MSNNQNSGWMNTSDFCLQRRRRQLLNKPPPRLDSLSYNPYLHFTQAQLDMRRKAEVLKYSAVSTNSKTNNLTKAEKYAQMARFSKGNGSFNRMVKIQETCPQDELIKTPNYSCDVPGPYTLLYMDETVELYNYGKGNTTVAVEDPSSNIEPFQTVQSVASPDNIALNSIPSVYDKSIPIASIYTQTQSNQEYNYQIPVLFDFVNEIGLSKITPVTVTVENVFVYIYYNKTLISTNDGNTPFTPVENIPIPEVVLDTFNSPSFVITPTSTFFSGNVNLGTIGIHHIQLCNQPHAIYDIHIMVVYTTSPNNVIRYRTIANASIQSPYEMGSGTIWFNEVRFLSAQVSQTTDNEVLITSIIKPVAQTLNVSTNGNGEIIEIGNGTTQIVLNGDLWWNSPNTFPQSGFINQLV